MQDKKGTVVAVVAVVVLALGGLGAWALMRDDTSNNTEMSDSTSMSSEEPMATNTIVDVASGDEQFSTLVTAVKAAGLVETLSGDGPFTVFAPTNAAFDKLPAGTLQNLLNNPEELKKVLTYHVVSGEVKAADVVKLTTANTVLGQNLTIKVDGSNVMVNNANVTKTDIMASNGVVHVIDTVLLPQ